MATAYQNGTDTQGDWLDAAIKRNTVRKPSGGSSGDWMDAAIQRNRKTAPPAKQATAQTAQPPAAEDDNWDGTQAAYRDTSGAVPAEPTAPARPKGNPWDDVEVDPAKMLRVKAKRQELLMNAERPEEMKRQQFFTDDKFAIMALMSREENPGGTMGGIEQFARRVGPTGIEGFQRNLGQNLSTLVDKLPIAAGEAAREIQLEAPGEGFGGWAGNVTGGAVRMAASVIPGPQQAAVLAAYTSEAVANTYEQTQDPVAAIGMGLLTEAANRVGLRLGDKISAAARAQLGRTFLQEGGTIGRGTAAILSELTGGAVDGAIRAEGMLIGSNAILASRGHKSTYDAINDVVNQTPEALGNGIVGGAVGRAAVRVVPPAYAAWKANNQPPESPGTRPVQNTAPNPAAPMLPPGGTPPQPPAVAPRAPRGPRGAQAPRAVPGQQPQPITPAEPAARDPLPPTPGTEPQESGTMADLTPEQATGELVTKMRQHVDALTETYVRGGVDEATARDAAMNKVGEMNGMDRFTLAAMIDPAGAPGQDGPAPSPAEPPTQEMTNGQDDQEQGRQEVRLLNEETGLIDVLDPRSGEVLRSEPAPQDPSAAPGAEPAVKPSLTPGTPGGEADDLRVYPDTPAPVADRMAAMLKVADGAVVLDPSAGRGALLEAVARRAPGTVRQGIEIDPEAVAQVRPEAGTVTVGDSLKTAKPGQADAVIVSPPWDNNPIEHLAAASNMVKPGGQVVALVPQGLLPQIRQQFGKPTVQLLSGKELGSGQPRAAIVSITRATETMPQAEGGSRSPRTSASSSPTTQEPASQRQPVPSQPRSKPEPDPESRLASAASSRQSDAQSPAAGAALPQTSSDLPGREAASGQTPQGTGQGPTTDQPSSGQTPSASVPTPGKFPSPSVPDRLSGASSASNAIIEVAGRPGVSNRELLREWADAIYEIRDPDKLREKINDLMIAAHADNARLFGPDGLKHLTNMLDASGQLPGKAPVVAKKPAADKTPAAPDHVRTLMGRLMASIDSGNPAFRTIIEARAFVGELMGKKIVAGTPEAKQVDEMIEQAIVLAAREIIAEGRGRAQSPRRVLDRLVALYNVQPNLGVRTSTSMLQQAYSTPAPLAWITSELAGIAPGTTVYEPTAGNGMLLIGASMDLSIANELNPDRLAALNTLGFKSVGNDATIWTPDKKVDVVIGNPPFGKLDDEEGRGIRWDTGFYKTKMIDHAIAFKALQAMKDDGRAVLILGGKKGTDDERRTAYRNGDVAPFWHFLFKNYKVVDHFTVSGDLYAKQGAKYPVDVVVINGRGAVDRKLPAMEPPRQYDSWSQLQGLLNDKPLADTRPPTGVVPPIVTGPVGADGGGGTKAEAADPVGGGLRGDAPAAGGVDDSQQPQSGGYSGAQSGPVEDGTRPSSDSTRGSDDADPTPVGPADVPDDGDREPGSGADPGVQGNDAGNVALPERTDRPEVKASELQTAYVPAAKAAKPIGTLVPKNMATATQQALAAAMASYGGKTAEQIVGSELGMTTAQVVEAFSAEQVDAILLAVYNVKQNKGFIIGDQTGVGKGRFVAAMLVWAERNGRIPVFVTEKANLYADIIRDTGDIGRPGYNLLMTNTGLRAKDAIELPDGRMLSSPTDPVAAIRAALQSFRAGKGLRTKVGKADVAFNAIATTYSQLQTVNGKETDRRAVMDELASSAMFIFDESHNAGGTVQKGWKPKKGTPPKAAQFIRNLIEKAKGVVYSSATYAKRPDVMDLYRATDMRLAVENIESLATAIELGGLPMQQVVAEMLARAGQYVRRERSFEGVTFGSEVVEADVPTADSISTVFRLIADFDKLKKKGVTNIATTIAAQAAVLGPKDNATGQAGVKSTNFTAIIHNIVAQMLLAMKIRQSADLVRKSLAAGEKVVLTLSNTMEGVVKEGWEMDGGEGKPSNATFRKLLHRYLERSREIKIKRPGGESETHYMTDAELGPAALQRYNEAKQAIEDLDVSDIPVSPIDALIAEIQRVPFTDPKTGALRRIEVAEITGRSHGINYADGNRYYRRPGEDLSPSGRTKTIKAFQDGRTDVMILNRAGSTGISLHADGKRAKDLRPRRMIVLQPDLNIDTMMQMFGRVHRAGQVVAPSYTLLLSNLPAEKRPAAVLMKKVASLNANVSADRKGAVSFDVPDIVNSVGDQAVIDMLIEDGELSKQLEMGFDQGDEPDEEQEPGTIVRAATGKSVLMPISEQDRFWTELERRIRERLDMMTRLGTNPLEAARVDLRARTIAKEVMKAPGGAAQSPFTEPVYVETVVSQIRSLSMTGEQVTTALAGINRQKWSTDMIAQTKKEYQAFWNNHRGKLSPATEAYRDAQNQTSLTFLYQALRDFAPGTEVELDGQQIGVVLSITRKTNRSDNPSALSSWEMQLGMATIFGNITLSLSSLASGSVPLLVRSPQAPYPNGAKSMIEVFDKASSGGTKKHVIVTGNLLAGYEAIGGAGSVVFFTNENGDLRPGILPHKDTDDPSDLIGRSLPLFSKPENIVRFMEMNKRGVRRQIKTADGSFTIETTPQGDYRFTAPKSRQSGGQYTLNQNAIKAAGADFVSVGANMVMTVPSERLFATIKAYTAAGTRFIVGDAEPSNEKREAEERNQMLQDYYTIEKGGDAAGGAPSGIRMAPNPVYLGSLYIPPEVFRSAGDLLMKAGGAIARAARAVKETLYAIGSQARSKLARIAVEFAKEAPKARERADRLDAEAVTFQKRADDLTILSQQPGISAADRTAHIKNAERWQLQADKFTKDAETARLDADMAKMAADLTKNVAGSLVKVAQDHAKFAARDTARFREAFTQPADPSKPGSPMTKATAAEREQVGKMAYYGPNTPEAGVASPRVQMMYDAAQDVMDNGNAGLNKFAAMGGTRTLPSGRKVTPKTTGKWMPTALSAFGREVMADFRQNGRDAKLMQRMAMRAVNQGYSPSYDEALEALVSEFNGQIQTPNRYFSKTRTTLPPELIEFDPIKVVPRTLQTNALVVAAGKHLGGFDGDNNYVDIGHMLSAFAGRRMHQSVIDKWAAYFRTSLGGEMIGSPEVRALVGNVLGFQFWTKLAVSPFSVLRNMFQPFVALADYPLAARMMGGLIDYPPIIADLTRKGQATKTRAEMAGSVPPTVNAADHMEMTGDGPIKSLLRSFNPFDRAQVGTHVRADAIARRAASQLLGDMMALEKPGMGLRKLATILMQSSFKSVTDPVGAAKKEIETKLERLGLTKAALANKLATGRRLSPTELDAAGFLASHDTQFTLSIASKVTWWESMPVWRIPYQFKNFTVRMSRLLLERYLKPAYRGHLTPLASLVITAAVGGEMVNYLQDVTMGKDKSAISALTNPANDTPYRDAANRLMFGMAQMGVFGPMQDISRGAVSWAAGPTIGTAADVAYFAADVAQGADLGLAAKKLATDQVPVLNHVSNASKMLSGKAADLRQYWWVRRITKEFADDMKAKPVGQEIAETLWRAAAGSEPRIHAGDYLARQAVVGMILDGDTKTAARTLSETWKNIPADKIRDKRTATKQALMNDSPMGNLPRSLWRALAATMKDADWDRIMEMQGQYESRVNEAIGEATDLWDDGTK